MRSFSSRSAAATAAVGVLAVSASLLGAGSAMAADKPHSKPVAKSACTVTAAQRAADIDALKSVTAQLAGHKLTDAEKKSLHAALVEMVTAAREAKMPAAVRAQKIAQVKDLTKALNASVTPDSRYALRTQIDAIRLELKTARLTGAERAAIAKKIHEMAVALKAKPSAAERAELRTQLKTLADTFRCKVAG